MDNCPSYQSNENIRRYQKLGIDFNVFKRRYYFEGFILRNTHSPGRSPVYSLDGMVATSHPLASKSAIARSGYCSIQRASFSEI